MTRLLNLGILAAAVALACLAGSAFAPPLLEVSVVAAGAGLALMVAYCLTIGATAPAIAAGAFLAVALAFPALAADGAVTVPWGDWLAALAGQHTHEILIGAMLWLFRRLPTTVYAGIQALRVEQLFERAIGYGLNAVAGAARGRNLTVEIGSEVLAEAVQYAIDAAPSLVRYVGGAEAVRRMIFARLELEPGASSFQLGVTS